MGERDRFLSDAKQDMTKMVIELTKVAANNQVTLAELIYGAIKSNSDILERYTYHDLDHSNRIPRLTRPIDPPEIWGCGVTYKRSRAAREFETDVKGIYDLVYEAERPETFFKGTARHCVGPNETIGIRGDSSWSVPEPELTFIIGAEQQIIGFTGGNDVSARDIEGANPLYLPQAKIYDGCCALGPAIVTVDEVGAEPNLTIECEIIRAEETVFENSTSTAQMKRSMEELRSYLCRYNPLPIGAVCLTGTGIVPPDEFTLESGDLVEIRIEKIGTLRNRVVQLNEN